MYDIVLVSGVQFLIFTTTLTGIDSRNVLSQAPFRPFKLLRTPKSFCLCGMFTGLEIKTEKLEKRIYSPKTNNKPLHVNVIYFMKYNYTFQNPKKLSSRMLFYYHFANLFHVWHNRRQLNSCISFPILSCDFVLD